MDWMIRSPRVLSSERFIYAKLGVGTTRMSERLRLSQAATHPGAHPVPRRRRSEQGSLARAGS